MADCVDIADPIAPDGLVDSLAEFDVGLIINRPLTRNESSSAQQALRVHDGRAGGCRAAPARRWLALVDEAGIGVTYEPGDPRDLARALDELAADRPRLEAMRRRARELALTRYNAEAQEPVLHEAWGL